MTVEPKSLAAAGAAFLIGLLTQSSVNVVGNMPLAEFVVLALMAFLVIRSAVQGRVPAELFRLPLFWIFLVAQIIAFGAYVVTDLYRGSTTNDMLRGWSRMLFLGMDIVAITYLFGVRASAFAWSQIGLMLGGLIAMALDGAQYDAYWKFGLGGPVTLAVFMLCPYLSRFLAIVVIDALAVLHLSFDFRSMGGVCLLAAMLLCVQLIPRQFRVLIIIPAIAAGVALTFWMNSRQRGDDDARASRSTVERTAMLIAASEGFFESPLIGQGSWFSNSRVMENFQLLRSEGARLAGVHGYAIDTEETNIAIHSQILVSVAEGGILGGTFFAVFGSALVWALWYVTIRRDADRITPLCIFFILNALWNLLFSPFSGAHRIGIAVGCGLVLFLWREAHTPELSEDDEDEIDDESLPATPAPLMNAPAALAAAHSKS